MQILWITNIPLPEFCDYLNIKSYYGGGWMVSLSNDIAEKTSHELIICSPWSKNEIKKAQINNKKYYAIPNNFSSEQWGRLISEISPDIVHLHGTEYGHGYKLINSEANFKLVVSIQGLVSMCAHHFYAGVPNNIIHKKTFAQLIIRDSIYKGKKDFEKRGETEQEIIKKSKYAIGRTTWDYGCVKTINPNIKYFFCGESLRDSFYKTKWDYDNCEKNSIFISQATYPIKGFHMFLKALLIVKKEFPDVKVYVGGKNITDRSSIKSFLTKRYYDKYITKFINKNHLADNITFLGPLNEKQMANEMKKAHVFISPSSIENSSNSIGEAMLIGTPIISSYVGGIPDLIDHKKEGLLYPFDEFYMLSFYIKSIFKNEELCNNLSRNARIRAEKQYSREENLNALLHVYQEIINDK